MHVRKGRSVSRSNRLGRVAALAWFLVAGAFAQEPPPSKTGDERYAKMPEEAVPYRRFVQPYERFFLTSLEYNGPGREYPEPENVSEVRLGFLGPILDSPDKQLGTQMLRGARMALEEANARGGYRGKPFVLVEHNDQALWGASSNEFVKLAYDDKVWAMLGSIDGSSTHIALRVTLKSEVPIVNTGSTDPTLTETRIPWIFRCVPDDRQQSYALADVVFKRERLTRVAGLRSSDRYGRVGIAEFRDAARRLGHPLVLELLYNIGEKDFRPLLERLKAARVEGVVIWGDAREAGLILLQMRQLGLQAKVFGADRLATPELLAVAGPAAEGLIATYPYDPTRNDPVFGQFVLNFQQRFGEPPSPFAAYAYDGMNLLVSAIQKAGLNRARIRDALAALKEYDGVTGRIVFDLTHNNVAPLALATVNRGRFLFRPAPAR